MHGPVSRYTVQFPGTPFSFQVHGPVSSHTVKCPGTLSSFQVHCLVSRHTVQFPGKLFSVQVHCPVYRYTVQCPDTLQCPGSLSRYKEPAAQRSLQVGSQFHAAVIHEVGGFRHLRGGISPLQVHSGGHLGRLGGRQLCNESLPGNMSLPLHKTAPGPQQWRSHTEWPHRAGEGPGGP